MTRYFDPLSPPPPLPDPHEELLASLSRINTFNPPVHTCSTGWTFNGFYAGPTSIAFLFYRLSQLYPDLELKSQSLLDWAHSYVELGSHYLSPTRPAVDASRCGVANETLCQLALRSLLRDDPSLARQLCSYSLTINSARDDGSNEWLFGRAGYLYLLRLLLRLTPDQTTSLTKLLQETIITTSDRILACPFPWEWYNQPYLGAVHGSMGIVTQVLLSSPDSHFQQYTQRLRPIIRSILDEQLPSGNFPPSHTTPPGRQAVDQDDILVQVCHGSPGVVLSLSAIEKYYSDNELVLGISSSIKKAIPDILVRGLLTKSPCLCHGIPTNALAIQPPEKMLEYLSYMSTANLEGDLGNRLKWMSKAGHSDEYAGLYTGEAGRAWVWALVDPNRKTEGLGTNVERRVIGYNDI